MARFPVLLVNLSANLQKSFPGLVSSGEQKLLTGPNMGSPGSVSFFATAGYYTPHIDSHNELCLVGLSNAFLVNLCPALNPLKVFIPITTSGRTEIASLAHGLLLLPQYDQIVGRLSTLI